MKEKPAHRFGGSTGKAATLSCCCDVPPWVECECSFAWLKEDPEGERLSAEEDERPQYQLWRDA